MEAQTRHFDFRLGTCRCQIGQNVTLVGGVLVEDIHVLTNEVSNVQLWQLFAHFLFSLSNHLNHCIIHVDKVEIGICDHDIGRTVVESRSNTRIFICQGFRRTLLCELLCHIVPFDNRANSDTGIVNDRACDQIEVATTCLN